MREIKAKYCGTTVHSEGEVCERMLRKVNESLRPYKEKGERVEKGQCERIAGRPTHQSELKWSRRRNARRKSGRERAEEME
jgi:hypothetical protein